MVGMINGVRISALRVIQEETKVVSFIKALDLQPGQKILDVGCGYGRYLQILKSNGFHAVGIERNQEIVRANTAAGLSCLHEEEFDKTRDIYDVIIMSHVIEHLNPQDLLRFLEVYLHRLKKGGHLIIATPLLTPYFYIDFDHVKPYYPTGINMVFGSQDSQVQYYSKHKIELVDIWFRRGPFRLFFWRGLYVKKYSSLPFYLDDLLTFLFKVSFGLIGRTTGWVGLYKKVSP